MDVLLAMKAAVRRWYVSGPMLLLTVAIAALSFFTAQSAWQTSGSLLIIPPLAPSGTPVDGGGTRLMAALLADNFNSDVIRADLKAKGATGVFQAKASSELPLVSVDVEASSAVVAANTLKIVLDNGDAVLADLQRRVGTNKADYYRSARSVEDSSPTFSASSRLIGVIGILLGGTAITGLLSAVVDGLLTRRRKGDPAAGDAESRDHRQVSDTPDMAPVRAALARRGVWLPVDSADLDLASSPYQSNGMQATDQEHR